MFDREILQKHSVDIRQFMDCRESTLPNGMRILDVYNGSGLHFTILPDRGMDIWTAHYNGLPLTWISQGAPHPPDYGSNWLRQFNGGLLTTCGLTHVGPPEEDDITGENRDIHGNFTRLRATNIAVNVVSDFKQNLQALKISGTLAEGRLFGEQMLLQRLYWVKLGEPQINITDVVTNLSDKPTPFMLLYHFNVGYPLVREGTKLHLPAVKSAPRDAAAKVGFDTWPDYSAAIPDYAEQVFYHHTKSDEGKTQVVLANPDFGVELAWATNTLPYFTQWKNVRQGIYVSGIEPGNCIPEGQNAARKNGRLVMLQPNETRYFETHLTVLGDAEAIQNSLNQIEQIQMNGTPTEHCKLDEF